MRSELLGREHCDGMNDCQADFHHRDCRAECSSCGHEHMEHRYGGHGECQVDVLGIVGWKRCTCRRASKTRPAPEPHSSLPTEEA